MSQPEVVYPLVEVVRAEAAETKTVLYSDIVSFEFAAWALVLRGWDADHIIPSESVVSVRAVRNKTPGDEFKPPKTAPPVTRLPNSKGT